MFKIGVLAFAFAICGITNVYAQDSLDAETNKVEEKHVLLVNMGYGQGQVALVKDDEEIVYGEEKMDTSAADTEKGNYKIGVKPSSDYKFVKWILEDEDEQYIKDYSYDAETNVTLDDENIYLRAILRDTLSDNLVLTLANGAKFEDDTETLGVISILLGADVIVRTEEEGIQIYSDAEGNELFTYYEEYQRYVFGDGYYKYVDSGIHYDITDEVRESLKSEIDFIRNLELGENAYVNDEFLLIIQGVIEDCQSVELQFQKVGNLVILTEGLGKFTYAYDDEELSDEYIANINIPFVGTYVISAKAEDDWKFVKWVLKDENEEVIEEYLDEEIMYEVADENNYLIAVFEYIEDESDAGAVVGLLVEGNANNTNIASTDEELEMIIPLTEKEIDAKAEGAIIDVYVEATDISNEVTEEDKLLIAGVLDGTEKVGIYLDLNLFKEIYGEEKIKVTETGDNIKISLEIPEELRKENRTFYIVRVHDGQATKIVPTIEDDVLTFETDRFSTYALVYADKEEESISPKTGDSVLMYMLLLLIGLIGFSSCTIYSLKKSN